MKTFQIITNSSCNLRCTYCYEYLDSKKNNVENIIEYLEAMVDKDTQKEDSVIIDFIGGEPFFVPDILDKVMEHCVSRYKDWGYKYIQFSISTNATLLYKAKQKAILEKYKQYLYIGVSLDGDKEKHDKHRLTISGEGSFDDAIRGLDTLLEYLPKSRINIKATFTKDSIKDYSRSIKFIYSRYGNKVSQIHGNFNFEEKFDVYDGVLIANEQMEVIRYIQSNDFFAEYLFVSNRHGDKRSINLDNPLKKTIPTPLSNNRCGSCTGMTSLGYEGKVYGCNRFSTMKKEGMELGEIKDGEFIDHHNPIVESVRNAYKDLPPWCNACRFNKSCSDCVAIPIDEGISHKDFYYQNRMCGYTKATNISKLYNKLLYLRNKGIKHGESHCTCHQ